MLILWPTDNKSCQKPTIELAGRLRENLILAYKDMSEVLLASKSLLHVDTNHRNLYSIYILRYTKQCPKEQQWQQILSKV